MQLAQGSMTDAYLAYEGSQCTAEDESYDGGEEEEEPRFDYGRLLHGRVSRPAPGVAGVRRLSPVTLMRESLLNSFPYKTFVVWALVQVHPVLQTKRCVLERLLRYIGIASIRSEHAQVYWYSRRPSPPSSRGSTGSLVGNACSESSSREASER